MVIVRFTHIGMRVNLALRENCACLMKRTRKKYAGTKVPIPRQNPLITTTRSSPTDLACDNGTPRISPQANGLHTRRPGNGPSLQGIVCLSTGTPSPHRD